MRRLSQPNRHTAEERPCPTRVQEATTRALRALTAFGLFREAAPSVFANSDASNLFRDASGGLRNYALFATSEQFLKSCAALGHSLETGQAAHDHALGQKVWEYMRDHPEDNVAFNRGLAEIRKDEQAAIARAYNWDSVTSVVDVGAGAGALVASILEMNPSIRGILFDRPADDRLLVIEMVPVPGQPDIGIALLDMAMMTFGGEARQRTEAEYRELFAATNFG